VPAAPGQCVQMLRNRGFLCRCRANRHASSQRIRCNSALSRQFASEKLCVASSPEIDNGFGLMQLWIAVDASK
jgi:hypothetical protein